MALCLNIPYVIVVFLSTFLRDVIHKYIVDIPIHLRMYKPAVIKNRLLRPILAHNPVFHAVNIVLSLNLGRNITFHQAKILRMNHSLKGITV